MTFLKIHELTVKYPFRNHDVLKGINLNIQKGEKLLILGPSGGGKSTLALALNGIIPKSIEASVSGTVSVANKSVQEFSYSEIARHVGILFQDPETQFCMLTVEDEIIFGMENLCLPKEEMEKRLERSLQLVGLTNWRKAQIKELSGGMKQKLGIASLLALDPEVLILDEPTANLDPKSTEEIFKLIEKLAKELNKTVIFIEHKLDDLLPILDRVIILGNDGKIIADDSPREIFQNDYSKVIEQGVWIPQVCKYAKRLEHKGMKWGQFPLSLSEWQQDWNAQGIKLPKLDVKVPENELNNVQQSDLPLLQLKDVSFSYQNHKVLKNISFSIQAGEIIALVGQNGTGKSTLAALLAGLLKPESGSIYIGNKLLNKLKSHELMQQVGFVFQNPEHQFICDTVEQELAYGLKILGLQKDEWKPRVDELLEQFQLIELRHQNPFSLSQGQKRRLSVATMLINNQQLLILDEPTFGQDYTNSEALMKLLTNLNQNGKTILMITHDMELVYKYADKVLLLHDGEMAYIGEVTSFFQDQSLLNKSSIKVPNSFILKQWLNVFEEEI